MDYMTTARDYELGERPSCQACGCELDIENDCHHDGYNGSPYAHGGRGSYGIGSHHFVFSTYCEHCAGRPAPLCEILQYNSSVEWLECGHKHSTPRDMFGKIRTGNKRRCNKCKNNCEQEFNAAEMMRVQRKEAFAKTLKAQRNCTVKLPFHDTRKNWDNYIKNLGLTLENCQVWNVSWYGCKKNERAAKLKKCLAEKAAFEAKLAHYEFAYNSDEH